jgi:hypothetical protein
MSLPISGTFVGTGNSAEIRIKGRASVLITGGNATVNIQRSTDQGSTWNTISRDAAGTLAAYATATLGFNGFIDEPEHMVMYRLNCSAYTSGTVTYRMGTER